MATVKSKKADVSSVSPSSERWTKANARNVSFFTLYGGQFTFSTQLLTLNYLLYSPTDAVPVSLETYTLYKIEEDSKTSTTENSTTKKGKKVITFSIQLVHSQNVWSLTNSINSFRFTNRVCGCIPGCSL